MQKIDCFTHILPAKYLQALFEKTPDKRAAGAYYDRTSPGVRDLDMRFRIMDRFDDYAQILCIAEPTVESVANPKLAAELAQIANDSMAELVTKYPDRFLAAIACLPMNNIKAAMKELDRAIIQLGFRGIQISTNILDRPLDAPEFDPIFEAMNYYRLPILMHPRHMENGPRKFARSGEKEEIPFITDRVGRLAQKPFNWTYETTLAMGRLVWSGMLEKYPNLIIVTHHCGGLLPYQANRISQSQGIWEGEFFRDRDFGWHPTKTPIEYYKMIYGDTAVWGSTATLMCGLDFFGPDHIVFGTDMGFGNEGGANFLRETIRAIEEMPIPEEFKKRIFQDNPRRLFQLPVDI
jgi:aminocarboxymuconate-semialdehyde decarboxylase